MTAKQFRSAAPRALTIAALLAALAGPARADKIFMKNGKVLDGIVQKESKTRVEFLYQGRGMIIPRERIDRIERESGGENLDMLIQRATEAVEKGDADTAAQLHAKAAEINGPAGVELTRIKELEKKIIDLRAMGNADERRRTAEALLKEAVENFDRIQLQKGSQLLLKALEIDPSYEAAHDEMAKFMRGHQPSLSMATEYFCERVDPEKVKPDHPIITLLPEIFVDEIQRLQAAKGEEEIRLHAGRVVKISSAFEAHPDWSAKANENQKRLIARKSAGILKDQIEASLDAGDYEDAMIRMSAAGPMEKNPELAGLAIRTMIGQRKFDEARQMLEQAKAASQDPAVIEKTINALTLYQQAAKAMDENDNKGARAVLDRLFALRGELMPEIFVLVADAKVDYDITEMEGLEGADKATEAADIAVKIYDYATAEKNRTLAAEAFARLAPKLAFKLKPVWTVDGTEIAVPPAWAETMKNALGPKFDLHFDDASPFELKTTIAFGSYDNAGARVLEASKQPTDPYVIDYITPDTSFTKLALEFEASHPLAPGLFKLKGEPAELAPDVLPIREASGDDRHKKGLVVFMDLTTLSDFNAWLEKFYVLYVPADLALAGAKMTLPKK